VPSVSVTSKRTDGIVAMRSMSYSRSMRSRTMSMSDLEVGLEYLLRSDPQA